MKLRVRKPEGWTEISFPDEIKAIAVAGGKVDGQLCLTLTGERKDGPRVVETGILDINPTDEEFLENSVPRTDDGTSLIVDNLRPG